MKAIKSYRQVQYEGMVFKQRIRINEKLFKELKNKIRTEILSNLPRRDKYVFTSGYETFLKPLEVINFKETNTKLVFLNQTQLRFINLFLKLKLSRLNTYLLIEGAKNDR